MSGVHGLTCVGREGTACTKVVLQARVLSWQSYGDGLRSYSSWGSGGVVLCPSRLSCVACCSWSSRWRSASSWLVGASVAPGSFFWFTLDFVVLLAASVFGPFFRHSPYASAGLPPGRSVEERRVVCRCMCGLPAVGACHHMHHSIHTPRAYCVHVRALASLTHTTQPHT